MSLIEQSGCSFWVTTTGTSSLDFIQDLGIPCIEAPELSQLLEENAVDNYPYTKSWDEGRADILALLHTSGSTGLPKLVPLYLATAATVDGFNLMEPVNGRVPTGVEWKGTRMLCAMPLFHVSIGYPGGPEYKTNSSIHLSGCRNLSWFIFCLFLSMERHSAIQGPDNAACHRRGP